MQSDLVLDITREALKTTMMLCGPLLLFMLVVGVATNVFQAVTQISETTVAVVPKWLAMILALVLFSHWMLDVLMDFTTRIFESIPHVIR